MNTDSKIREFCFCVTFSRKACAVRQTPNSSPPSSTSPALPFAPSVMDDDDDDDDDEAAVGLPAEDNDDDELPRP
jgi:hypothetical protein